MKLSVLLPMLLFSVMASAVDIREAMLDPDLEITIRGLDGSELAYADKDIWIGVMNQKDHPVTITAEPGFIVSSEEFDVQDMILTEPLEMVASNEYYNETGLHAMCIEASNKTPDRFDDFRPGNYAEEKLSALAKFIADHGNQYQNFIGQDAMWVLSDGHSLYDISGGLHEIRPLLEFMAGLLNTTYDPSKVTQNVDYIERTLKEYALYLKFYLQREDDIKLQLFNQKGEHVRDLLVRNDQEAGRYDMKYKVSLLGLIGEKFYVRLYVGEEMRKEFLLLIKEA